MTENVLRRIQNEVGEWAANQFGGNVSKWTGQTLGSLLPLLGMLEEVGELCHVTGYRHSGRGFTTEEEYQAAIKDGLADLFVFACDYAEREGIKLDEGLSEVWEKVKLRRQSKWLEDKANEENRNREEEMKAAIKEIKTGPITSRAIEESELKGGPDTYIIPDKNIARIKGEANLRVQQTFSGIREVKEQTGQGFAEPPKDGDDGLRDPETGDYKQCEFCSQYLDADGTCPEGCPENDSRMLSCGSTPEPSTVTERLFPDGPGYYRNNWGPGGEVVKLTDEEVEQMKKEGVTMMDCTLGSSVDPPYLYGKSREVRTGEDKQPEDGWTVARKIATTFVDGQNLAYALKSIDSFEEQWKKEHRLRTKKLGQLIFESLYDKEFCHGDLEGKEIQQYEKAAAKLLELRAVYVDLGEQQRLALTGKLAIAALDLDPDNTSPKDVKDEIINLVAFKSDCNPASEE